MIEIKYLVYGINVYKYVTLRVKSYSVDQRHLRCNCSEKVICADGQVKIEDCIKMLWFNIERDTNWFILDGVEYKINRTETVEEYLKRLEIPIANAKANEIIDML